MVVVMISILSFSDIYRLYHLFLEFVAYIFLILVSSVSYFWDSQPTVDSYIGIQKSDGLNCKQLPENFDIFFQKVLDISPIFLYTSQAGCG